MIFKVLKLNGYSWKTFGYITSCNELDVSVRYDKVFKGTAASNMAITADKSAYYLKDATGVKHFKIINLVKEHERIDSILNEKPSLNACANKWDLYMSAKNSVSYFNNAFVTHDLTAAIARPIFVDGAGNVFDIPVPPVPNNEEEDPEQ